MTSRRPAILLLASLLVVTACSNENTAIDTTESPTTAAPTTTPETVAPTTTTEPVDPATAFTEAGPYPVGVTSVAIDGGPTVEIWYPGAEGTTGEDSYDVRDFTPQAVRDLLQGDVDATFTYAAGRDAAVADGVFPIALFSHGFSGMRMQSTFLTSHLASWGMIVVAPDHPSRDLEHALVGQVNRDPNASVGDLRAALDHVIAEGAAEGGRFSGHVDPEHVVAIGHSAGGGTILGAASADDRIDGFVSMASGRLGDDTAPMPAVPSLFVAGSVDAVVSAETVTRPAFEAATSPSLLWIIEGVGHNGFDDFCTLGGGTGIIGVAEAAGLGALLDAQPQFRTLGEDGCIEPAVPVDTTFPIVLHVVTAWTLQLFGLDPGTGLDASVAGSYSTPVDIESR